MKKTSRHVSYHFFWGWLLCLFASVSLADNSRLEERLTRLFYWQMSQALDLSTSEEKQMTRILDNSSAKRIKAIQERETTLNKIAALLSDESKIKTSQDVVVLVKSYKRQLMLFSEIDQDEHEQLHALLGDLKLLKFYNERKLIIERIKKVLN